MTNSMIKAYVLLAFGAVALAALGIYVYLEAKRQEQLRQLAVRLGCNFEAEAKQLPEEEFGALPLFTRGHSKRARNVLRGAPHGAPLVALDYQYTTGYGKHKTTSRHTVVVFHFPGKQLPWFTMAPEHVFHRLGAIFGYEDIDFPTHAEFSQAYFLRGKDEPAIRALLQPRLAELSRLTGWAVEGGGSQLLVYRPGKRVAPADLRQFLDDTNRMAHLFV